MNVDIKLVTGNLALNIKDSDLPFEDLCAFAARQNTKRGFLFVSKVLGKHYPVKPCVMEQIHELLAHKIHTISKNLDNITFIGFAETAIGLGAGVFHTWQNLSRTNQIKNAFFIPTTRFHFDQPVVFEFKEEHSHATDQLIFQPREEKAREIFTQGETLVLVDDEISTGKTLFNFIEQFVEFNKNVKNVFLVSIKNWISDENKNNIIHHFKDINIEFVSVLEGEFSFVKDENFIVQTMPKLDGKTENKDYLFNTSALDNNIRFGNTSFTNYNFDQFISTIDLTKKTLVLGTNEYLVKPFFFAQELEKRGCEVFFQSTTRSPILVEHDIDFKLISKDNYNDGMENYIYNVSSDLYEQIIICYETKDKFGFDLDQQLGAINYFMEQDI